MNPKDQQYLKLQQRFSGPIISLFVISIILIVNSVHSYLIYLDLVVDQPFSYWHLIFLAFPIVFDLGVIIITLNGSREASKIYAFFVFFVQMYFFLTETSVSGKWYYVLATYALIFIWSAGVSGLLYYFTDAFASRIERKEYQERVSARQTDWKARALKAEKELSALESSRKAAERKALQAENLLSETESLRRDAENSRKILSDLQSQEKLYQAIFQKAIFRLSHFEDKTRNPETLKRNLRNYRKQLTETPIHSDKRAELELKIGITEHLLNPQNA